MSRKTQNRANARSEKKRKRRHIARLAWIGALLGVLLLLAARGMQSYPASDRAKEAMAADRLGGRITVFAAQEPKAGFIFYPGALVEHEAYAPLMQAIASRGITCLLVEMPLDLAVLDIDAAEGLREAVPQIETWMIGGHSLGGAMAAAHAAKQPELFDALVLLGAYSPEDLSDTGMKVLCVVGSEDGVINREKYEESLKNYPASFRELSIDGGCHAYFGDYGAQKGDGTPTISRELQIGMTASAIAALLR